MFKKLMTLFLAVVVMLGAVAKMEGIICLNSGQGIIWPAPPLHEQYVINGSTLYFRACSALMSHCGDYETAYYMPNYDAVKNLAWIQTAKQNLAEAEYYYLLAAQTIDGAKPDKSVVRALRRVSYDSSTLQSDLNRPVIQMVKGYMEKCDIGGFYGFMAKQVRDIRSTVENIENALLQGLKPEPAQLWELLQKLSTTTLLGNYYTVLYYSVVESGR